MLHAFMLWLDAIPVERFVAFWLLLLVVLYVGRFALRRWRVRKLLAPLLAHRKAEDAAVGRGHRVERRDVERLIRGAW